MTSKTLNWHTFSFKQFDSFKLTNSFNNTNLILSFWSNYTVLKKSDCTKMLYIGMPLSLCK